MRKTARQIGPQWTLGELKTEYPGVEMALFAQFGIGSRERSGFSADEKLEELLRRHLVFDSQRACDKLNELAREDLEHSIEALQLASDKDAVIIDARSSLEFERAHLEGALLLSFETVSALQSTEQARIVTVCRDGTQAPAASRVLRSQGLPAKHLAGGLENWALEVDPDFPVLYPLAEEPGRWYLLADDQTLRYRREQPLAERTARVIRRRDLTRGSEVLQTLLKALPDMEMIVSTPNTFSVRGLPTQLQPVISALPREVRDADVWEQMGVTGDRQEDQRKLERVLAHEAPEILGSHKGTVEVKLYQDRVLTLQLGGECAGCASAQITTQRELAASLYRAVPLLDRIES